MWFKIKIGLVIVAVLAVGGMLLVAFVSGSGAVTVVAPKQAAVSLTIDGKPGPSAPAGSHVRVNVEQGEHQVRVESAGRAPATFQLKVTNGSFDALLPLDGQCFAVLDVTNFVYKKVKLRQHLSQEIEVKSRLSKREPMDMPAGVFYSLDELPKSIGENQRTELLIDLPCPLLAKSDEEIIKATQLF